MFIAYAETGCVLLQTAKHNKITKIFQFFILFLRKFSYGVHKTRRIKICVNRSLSVGNLTSALQIYYLFVLIVCYVPWSLIDFCSKRFYELS